MRRSHRFAATALTAVLAGLIGLPAGTAYASPELPRAASVQADDGYAAGYVAQLSGWRRSVVATFVVPTLGECGAKEEGNEAIVQLDSHDGQSWAGAQVTSYCHRGVATHYAEFNSSEAGVIGIQNTVEDGDVVTISCKVVGNDAPVQLIVTDVTQGWSVRERVDVVVADEASVIETRHVVLVGHMDVLRQDLLVREVKVSGQNLGQAKPTRETLINEAEGTSIQPTKISHGTAFTNQYVPLRG